MIHSTAIVKSIIPLDSKVREFAIVRGNVQIGHHVDIYQFANVGYGTIIEDDVYFGAQAITMNTRKIRHGRKNMPGKAMQDPVLIKRGARIATGALILPGVVIGEECLIGAGSVVTKSTKPYSIYYGNPACYIGPVPQEEWLQPPKSL